MKLLQEYLILHRKDILAKTSVSKQLLSLWILGSYEPKFNHVLILLKFDKNFSKIMLKMSEEVEI